MSKQCLKSTRMYNWKKKRKKWKWKTFFDQTNHQPLNEMKKKGYRKKISIPLLHRWFGRWCNCQRHWLFYLLFHITQPKSTILLVLYKRIVSSVFRYISNRIKGWWRWWKLYNKTIIKNFTLESKLILN